MRKVLVVDDSETMRGIVRELLAPVAAEYTCVEASSAQRAMALARLTVPDVILADVLMRDMDGVELVEALLAEARPEVRRIPVVLLTASHESELEARGLAAGAYAVLRKPVGHGALLAALRGAIARGRTS